MSTRKGLILTAALLASGCGGEEPAPTGAGPPGLDAHEAVAFERACAEIPGCAEPRFEAPGPVESVWRVVVVRDPRGAIWIDYVDSVEVPAGDGVPVGPLAGTHRLVGLDRDDQPVDGQLLHFPETLRLEFRDRSALPEEIDLSDREVDTVGYVRTLPTIETLAIQDVSGRTVATQPVPRKAAALVSHPYILASPALAQTIVPGGRPRPLPPYCSHVRLLEGERDRGLARNIAYAEEITLVAPGLTQRALTFAALGRMKPLLCQSVSRIAFGRYPDATLGGAVRTISTGDMILINEMVEYVEGVPAFEEEVLEQGDRAYQLELMQTILHEAAHSADALLNLQGSRPDGFAGDWELPARSLASETLDKVRLEKGLRDEWWRVHESFRRLGWAEYHQGEGAEEALSEWSSRQISDAGFMSPYGATTVDEDLAEMVGWTYMADDYGQSNTPEAYQQYFGCQEMTAYGKKDLPARLAAVYTKLSFLKDLGLVAPEDVDACMGPDLTLPVQSPGFTFWLAGSKLRTYGRGVTANIGTTSTGNRVFEMKAEGEAIFDDKSYPGILELRLDLESKGVPIHKVAWPRGVYELGLFGDNNLRLRLDGAPAGDFDVKDGFVLVAEASNDRIAGSAFVTIGFRIHAPLPVPQKWDPALIIRFLIEN